MPEGLVLDKLMDTNEFLDASVNEVVKTLAETILLVIVVVYVFLQSVRSTVIPTVSIIVSLIGTFAFMYVAGFSLNLLTLLALVLVIGTVVDDAIVVVEAVQAQFDNGVRSPYVATNRAMDGISAAIVTTSLVFMSVFIPTSFMGGTSGTYYKEFGLTMAAAVGISAINALTLCPALCAMLMTPHGNGDGVGRMSFSRMMVEVLPGKSSTWRSTGSLMWSEVVSSSLTEYTPGSKPEIRISPFSSVVRSR